MRNLTPVKEKAEAKENEENEEKKDPTNEENVDKPTEAEIVKTKPKFKTKTTRNPEMNSIVQFLSPSRPKSLFASALLKGEIPQMKPNSKWMEIKERKVI